MYKCIVIFPSLLKICSLFHGQSWSKLTMTDRDMICHWIVRLILSGNILHTMMHCQNENLSGGGRKSTSGKIAVVEYVWYLLLILQNCYQLSLNNTLCITTHYLTHAFLVQEKSFVLCRRCCTAHSTQHVTTSSSRRARHAWYATHCCVMCIKLLSP